VRSGVASNATEGLPCPVYFKPESVQLAIQMLDDSDFRLGEKGPMGPMRVTEADASYKSQKDQPLASEQAKKKGTGANRDRNKIIKKNKEMNECVSTTRANLRSF
jgi:HIV Tat-specific factor 1